MLLFLHKKEPYTQIKDLNKLLMQSFTASRITLRFKLHVGFIWTELFVKGDALCKG